MLDPSLSSCESLLRSMRLRLHRSFRADLWSKKTLSERLSDSAEYRERISGLVTSVERTRHLHQNRSVVCLRDDSKPPRIHKSNSELDAAEQKFNFQAMKFAYHEVLIATQVSTPSSNLLGKQLYSNAVTVSRQHLGLHFLDTLVPIPSHYD